jgi:ketosteroid isomerase-like protein
MASEALDVVQRSYEYFRQTGTFDDALMSADYVWDMSTFEGWPEQQVYHGVEGARQFIAEWTAPFDEWQIDQEDVIDAGGGKVVAVMRQRGRHRLTGMPVDMLIAQVFTVRDGLMIRMEMYSDPAEALAAVGTDPRGPARPPDSPRSQRA